MARPSRAVPPGRPAGFWFALAATVVTLALLGGVATLASVFQPQQPAQTKAVPGVKDLKNDQVKSQATQLTDCAPLSDGSGWVATGTAKNAGKKTQSFTVTVFFFDGDTAVSYAHSTVQVPANRAGQWAAFKRFHAGTAAITCKVIAVS